MHKRCAADLATPHISGTFPLPGGTGIEMVTDASMPDGRIVLFSPRDAFRLYEEPKRVELQRSCASRRLVAMDAYRFVGIKRDLITGARTAMTFGVKVPQGSPPGFSGLARPPPGSPGSGAWLHRLLGGATH